MSKLRIVYALPAILIVLLIRINTPPFIGDDAYMTFRVVRNAMEGKGFVYNANEYFYVTTTVLWGNLLRIISFIFSSTPEIVYFPTNMMCDVLNCILIYLIASNLNRFPVVGLCASLLYSFCWFMNYSSIIGMESSFFISILCIGSLFIKRMSIVSSVASSCACLIRPEGFLFLFSKYFVLIVKNRKLPWRDIVISMILVGGFVVGCLYYFGTIIPNAAIAKKLAYHRQPLQAAKMLGDFYAVSIFSPLQYASHLMRYAVAGFFILIWLYGAYKETKNKQYAQTVLCLFNILVSLLYIVTNPLLFEWYVAPLIASYAISFSWGVYHIVVLIHKNFKSKVINYAMCIILFIGFASEVKRYELPSFSLSMSKGTGGYLRWPGLDYGYAKGDLSKISTLGPENREKLYIDLAHEIANNVTENTLVLAPEFGAFGYHSSARIMSSIGHNNPEMFKFLPVSREVTGMHINNGISMEMVNHFQPDYVLSLETFIRNGLLKSEEFLSRYELVKKHDSRVFGSRGLYLFRKKTKK